MKKIIYLVVILLSFISCKKEVNTFPNKFTETVLNDVFLSLEEEQISLKKILKAHEGKNIVIDIWASWCGDCIKGIPKVKALQNKYPNAAYVFLSLDRKKSAWKHGIEKYKIKGNHYYIEKGKESPFAKFVNIDWIPRYMITDSKGNISLFKVIEADDDKIERILKK